MVTTTYGHGYLTDCNVTGTLNNQGADGTQTILYGDVLQIYGKANNVANEYCEVSYDFTDLNPSIYTHYVVRWNTTNSGAPGMGANCYLNFSSGTKQYLVGTLAAPAFSTYGWTVNTGTIDTPAGEDISSIVFAISDSPDTLADGTTGYANFDFALLCKGTFTLPNTDYGMRWNPGTRDIYLPIPGRVTDITQRMGSESATATLGCDLLQGTWTTASYANYPGEIFDYIAHESHSEPFQWVTGLDERSMKATIHPTFNYEKIGDQVGRRLDLELREYSLMDKSYDTHRERWDIT